MIALSHGPKSETLLAGAWKLIETRSGTSVSVIRDRIFDFEWALEFARQRQQTLRPQMDQHLSGVGESGEWEGGIFGGPYIVLVEDTFGTFEFDSEHNIK